jgi:dTDP-4-amino-4,6-dideoxygalactose transaminase
MEFIDLKAQYKKIKPELDDAVKKVLDKGDYILGEEVRLLERELSEYVGTKYCVTCANGTDALVLALQVFGVGKGDAVFVPSFTFFATAEVVSIVGAVPVFVDVDPRTFNIDPVKLEEAVKNIKSEGNLIPKVVIPVALFGLPHDVEEVNRIAKKHNLYILEDAAQGFGGEYNGAKACSFGDISTTSFFPAKPLGCYGDGGAIFTDNEEYYEHLLSLRVHGKGSDKYDNIRIGYNSRLDTLQAAILRVKLVAFKNHEMRRRGELANLYNKLLKGKVVTPLVPKNCLSSYAQYTIILKDKKTRDDLIKHLKDEGIPSMVYYVKGMHQQTAYKTSPCVYYDCSVTEDLCDRVLSLPFHPYLEDMQIKKVCDAILEEVKL